MKKSDIAMIVLIASLSVMVAFLIANSLPFLKPSEKGVKVPTAQKIETETKQPDERVFNTEAINPTVETYIGGDAPAQ